MQYQAADMQKKRGTLVAEVSWPISLLISRLQLALWTKCEPLPVECVQPTLKTSHIGRNMN
jgi:hypothetical protein